MDGALLIKVDMVQSVALAVATYWLGSVIKNRVGIRQKFCIPSPVVGGMICALLLSALEYAGLIQVTFDSTLQKLLMLGFFTTIGLMASLKMLTAGGKLLPLFLAAVTVLAILQNLLGMGAANLMGIDMHYGILAGSVSMMGGLGTAAAFGPYFEQTYGITGGTAMAITAATFGMVAALMIGGPFGEWLIRRYKVQVPTHEHDGEPLRIPEEVEAGIRDEKSGSVPTFTHELMKAVSIVTLCLAVGTVVSNFLGNYITLPAYIGSMIVAAVVRNVGDFTGAYKVQGKGMDAVADICLVLFVTMAINGLKLHELLNLAGPLVVMLALQTVLMLVFALGILYFLLGRDYTAVMLTVGGIGFSMGATANGLANMQALAEKYGSSPQAWLIVSVVGAFLIDLINALLITWMGTW